MAIIKKYNFIYKGRLIDIYAENFEVAQFEAERIYKEIDELEY